MTQQATFDHILDLIDTLSPDEQEDLINIVRHHQPLNLSKTDKEMAKKRFESHFGEIELDEATSVNNESIDADLAKEYANNHEGD